VTAVEPCALYLRDTVAESVRVPPAPPQHLGDDLWTSAGRVHQKLRPLRRGFRYNRSIVVPHRLNLVAAPMPRDWASRTRPLLVFGAFGLSRHPGRLQLARAIWAAEHIAPGRVHVGGSVDSLASGDASHRTSLAQQARSASRSSHSPPASLAEAHDVARNATFCLCPSGDAPSLTQRLYAAVSAGCLPVVIDLYARAPLDPQRGYPFPSLVEWSQFVVEVPANRAAMPAIDATRRGGAERYFQALQREFAALLPRLQALESQAPARRRYMQSIAHLLRFDSPTMDKGQPRRQDAASAAVYEIAGKLGLRVARPY